MGTRTYSRRRADGTRVPTALGIRTGKFTGGAGAQGAPAGERLANTTITGGTGPTIGGTITEIAKLGSVPMNESFANLSPRILSGEVGTDLVRNRRLVEDFGAPRRQDQRLTFDSSVNDTLRGVFGVANSNYRDILTTPDTTYIADSVITGGISASNGRRILQAVDSVVPEIPIDRLTPTQAKTVRRLVNILGGLAAVRSQLLDMQTMNPRSEIDSKAVDRGLDSPRAQSNIMGNAIGSQLAEVSRRAHLVANAINYVMGEGRPVAYAQRTQGGRLEPYPGEGYPPPRDTFGGQAYMRVTAAMGAISYNSALKMARENRGRINEVRTQMSNASEAER